MSDHEPDEERPAPAATPRSALSTATAAMTSTPTRTAERDHEDRAARPASPAAGAAARDDRQPRRHAGDEHATATPYGERTLEKVPASPVMNSSVRLIVPVPPSTHSSAPCQPIRPASVTTNDGIPKPRDPEARGAGRPRRRRRAPTSDRRPRAGMPCARSATAMTAAHRPLTDADREVDLAEQQHEHDADRDRADRGHLERRG